MSNPASTRGARSWPAADISLTRTDWIRGLFMELTLLADVTNDMKVAPREEIFGPVLVAIKFRRMREDVLPYGQ